MTATQILILIIVIAVVAGCAIWVLMRNRSKKLQTRFGPEYHRLVQQTGSKMKAEAELERLEKRVGHYAIHPLSTIDRDRFRQSWRSIQATFVDEPIRAFTQADELLGEVMSVRGYPTADFEQRAAELSVDHGDVVEHYRIAHEIAVRGEQSRTSTEELRQGMIHYRALFDELVGEPELQERTSHVHT